MICLFPSGLFFDDLVQLSKLNFIHAEWNILLQKILNTKDTNKLAKPPTPEIKARTHHALERKLTPNPTRTISTVMFEERKSTLDISRTDDFENEKIKAGNYYWITIHKDSIGKGLFFQPSQSVCHYIRRSLKTSVYKPFLQKFEYLTVLSLSLIIGTRNNYYYNERLVENSLIAEHGVWKIREDNYIYQKYLESSRELTYLETLEKHSFKELKSIFWSHDSNFLSLLEVDIINDIIKNSSNPTLSHRFHF